MRPVFVKLGGSVITHKSRPSTLQRSAAKRLVGEVARHGAPTVLFHGAGSFGHPQAAAAGIGTRPVDERMRPGVAATLAAAGRLHAEVVALADAAGLRPISVPLHLLAGSEGDALVDLPVEEVQRLLSEGFTPVIGGTLVRDGALGWRVASADESMQAFAEELTPRLVVFATDVDGVYDPHPDAPQARLLDAVPDRGAADRLAAFAEGPGEDVTGRMRGKLLRALAIAESCPVLVVHGGVRGRLLDALKGKAVRGTRIGTA